MTIAEIAHTKYAGAINGGTTPTIDTSGADFIVQALISFNAGATLSDSYGNSWTGRNTYTLSGGVGIRLYDTGGTLPTVGASHTFTTAGAGNYGATYVESFSGMNLVAPLDQQNGATGTGSLASKGTGAITPAYLNTMVVTAVGHTSTGIATVAVAYTSSENTGYSAGNNYGGGIGWLTQNAATSRGPTWTFSPNTSVGAAVVVTSYRAAVPRSYGFVFG